MAEEQRGEIRLGDTELDRQDWWFSDAEFQEWERHLRKSLDPEWKFTVDLCANHSNSKTTEFHEDVLRADLSGEQFYVCPPFTSEVTPLVGVLRHIREEHGRMTAGV